jgi:hypothetical protein
MPGNNAEMVARRGVRIFHRQLDRSTCSAVSIMSYHRPKPDSRVCWLIGFSLAAIVYIAVTRVACADEEPSKAPADDAVPAPLTITGTLEDALFGKPIEGAKLTITKLDKPRTEGGKEIERIEATTNEDGIYKFQLPTDRPWKVPPGEQLAIIRTADEISAYTAAGLVNYDAYPLEIEIRHGDYAPLRTEVNVRRIWPQQPGRAAGPIGTRASVVYGRIVEVQPQSRFIEGFGQPGAPADPDLRLLTTLELRPAKEVTGVLQSPEGKPIAGVRIFAHSQVPRTEREAAGTSPASRGGFGAGRGTVSRVTPTRYAQSEDESFSDAQGRFHVSMITPGEGMIWIYPDREFAPQMKVLYDERGDLGTIKLVRGTPIAGCVLDAEGKPLVGVFVAAVPWVATQPKYSSNIIEQRVHRAAESDSQGNFALGPLPPGEYRVEPTEFFQAIKIERTAQSRHEVPGLFVPQKLTLRPGEERASIELRAAPTVTIDGHIVVGRQAAFPDAQQLHEAVSMNQLSLPTIDGTIDGLPYRQTVKIDVQGRFSALVPKGLRDTVLQMYAQSDGAQPQWRLGAEGHPQTTSRIRLGTLEKDFRDLQIVYPQRPSDGAPPQGALMGVDAVIQQQPAQGGQGGFGGRGGFGGGRRGGRGFGGGFGGVPQPGEGDADGGPE